MKRINVKFCSRVDTSVQQTGSLPVSRPRRYGQGACTLVRLVLPLLFFAVVACPNAAGAYDEGPSNNFFGTSAGSSITSGDYDSFFGGSSGPSTNSGSYNSFYGWHAGFNNTSGSYNGFFGSESGRANTTGQRNVFLGDLCGKNTTTGSYNVVLGQNTGFSNTVENYNTFIGYGANLNPGSAPTTNPVTNATAIGARAYVSSSNSLVLGSSKGVNGATADVNVGIGTHAPQRQLHLKGANAVFRMDRPGDTAAFMLVRTDATGSPLKTFVVGANASGTNNGELVVNDLGTAVAGPGTRRMTIRNNGAVQFTGTVTAAGYYTSSSLALKDNVRTFANALDAVSRLRGVRFDWKDSGQPAVGLIAEEVEQVVPEVVTHADNGAAAGVSYASLVGVLVEAVKEQQKTIEAQQAKVDDQLSALDQQERRLVELQNRLDHQEAKLDEQQAELTVLREELGQFKAFQVKMLQLEQPQAKAGQTDAQL